ncbi:MAG: phosphatase PAP2 family protein [Candidatus Nanopelagicales bacterium]
MSVVFAIAVAAGLAALLAAGMTWSPRVHADVVDPEAEERWILRRLRHHPRFADFVRRRLDPVKTGGLLLTTIFGIVLLATIVIGLLLTMVRGNHGLAAWDQSVAQWGSDHATDTSTRLLELITQLGSTAVCLVALTATGVIDYVRHRNANVILFLATVGGGVLLLNNVVKWLVERERPEVDPLTGFAGSSFPSGHTASAAACWAAIALVLGRHHSRRTRSVLAGVAAAIAILVAASRALLGVHWFTDVLAGLALGWGWFTVVAILFGGRIQRLGEPVERAAAGTEQSVRGEQVDRVESRKRS